jgi:hypothetical protein
MEVKTDIVVLWVMIPIILCPSSISVGPYQTTRYHQKENHKKKKSLQKHSTAHTFSHTPLLDYATLETKEMFLGRASVGR